MTIAATPIDPITGILEAFGSYDVIALCDGGHGSFSRALDDSLNRVLKCASKRKHDLSRMDFVCDLVPCVAVVERRHGLMASRLEVIRDVAIEYLLEVPFEKLKCACVKLFVKGNAVESVCISTDFGRSILQLWGAWSEKCEMRRTRNEVKFRTVGKCIGKSGNRCRQHAIAAELRSPKLDRCFHVFQALGRWKHVERIR